MAKITTTQDLSPEQLARVIGTDEVAAILEEWDAEKQAAVLNEFERRSQAWGYSSQDYQLLWVGQRLAPKTVELLERLVAFAKAEAEAK